MDLFMPVTLEEIYDRLNFVDPAVKCRTQNNKWGGAADIGGSPRESGTKLSPAEISYTCRDAATRAGIGTQAYRFGMTTALVGLVVLIGYLLKFYWNPVRWFSLGTVHPIWSLPQTGFVLSIIVCSAVALLSVSRCRSWQYGWIYPMGIKWWFFLPLAILAALAGGVWAPRWLATERDWLSMVGLGIVGMPLAAEILFRSLSHGLLTQGARIQRSDTRLFVSWPNLGATLLYVGFICLLMFFGGAGELQGPYWQTALGLFSAAVFGMTVGMVRERSQSLYPAILFHMISAAAALLVLRFF
jgi:hypothetical protein